MTAALYRCEITHVRAHPIRRAFRHRSYLWLVDLDDLRRLLGCALRHPWVTAQVTALIHWQGSRLAARLPIIPRPAHYPQEGVR